MNADRHTPDTTLKQEIWDYLKAHPRVTRKDIAKACSASDWAREQYLRELRTLGILKRAGHDRGKPLWTIFDTADTVAYSAGRRGSTEAAIWQAMRALNVFTHHDLSAALASIETVTNADIRAFCAMLQRARYLAIVAPGRGETSSPRYKLTKNTGPLPPVQKRMTVVVDANEDRIVYARGERL